MSRPFSLRKYIDGFLNYLAKGGFLKAIAKLSGATVLGQIISVLSSIILTRLYSPADFGVLGVFTALASQLAVFICLRYEWAILPAKEDEKAADLLFLACIISGIVTLLITVSVIIGADQIAAWVKVPALAKFLWLMPIATLFAGIYQVFNYWALRQKEFSVVAKSQVAKNIWSSSTQIGLGFLNLAAFGLLFGYVVNQISGVYPLLLIFWRSSRERLAHFSFRRSLAAGREYLKFSFSCVTSSFFNYAALSAPALFIAYYYDTETVGLYALAQRITSIPAVFIGNAVSQVYFSHACELIHQDPKELKKLFDKTSLLLFGVSFLAALFLLAGPWIVPIVFGAKWQVAGVMTQYMIPMLLFTIAVSPLTMLEWVDKSVEILIWHIIRLGGIVTGFYLCHVYHLSSTAAILVFSIISAIMYAILFVLNRLAINELIRNHVPGSGENNLERI
jgi:O-antigen/teichoic acid export membrane protein